MTRYRRASDLVIYWRSSGPVAFSCRSGSRLPITQDVLGFLNAIPEWRSVNDIAAAQPHLGSPREVRTLLRVLVRHRLVEQDAGAADRWLWSVWSPEAAFFHFRTRNPTSIRPRLQHERHLREKAKHTPPPPATKSLAGARLSLPPSGVEGALGAALQSRRTWRRFAARPLPLGALGSLLHLTFGVQRREWVEGQGPLVRKTSPSGGARHSIEAYLLALNVDGVARGAYHYDADANELVRLARLPSTRALTHALADQDYFTPAGAIVIMTAMFERAMWRYPFSRAYRSILAEAGHLGQTFCLVATALGLAPFCTMAYRDSALERMIRVDGVEEAAMYVVGVGARPPGRVDRPGEVRRRPRLVRAR